MSGWKLKGKRLLCVSTADLRAFPEKVEGNDLARIRPVPLTKELEVKLLLILYTKAKAICHPGVGWTYATVPDPAADIPKSPCIQWSVPEAPESHRWT